MSEKITTCLILNGAAESAAEFYTSIFEGSRVRDVMRAPPGGFLPEGDVLAVTLELAGREMMIINRGPEVAPNDAMSLVAHCADQAEIDRLWSALTAGGSESQCGWLKDRFGVSWQIVPETMDALMGGDDPAAASRAFNAMLGMRKLDIAGLEAARSSIKEEGDQ